MKKLLLITLLVLPSLAWSLEATYQVKIIGNFTEDVFVGDNFPRNPHFSPLNVVSHNKSYSLFPIGGIATPGVQDVAETGNPSALEKELSSAQRMNKVLDFTKSKPFDGDKVADVSITVKADSPYLSVLTMIAPSPDWVVGVNGVKLFKDGQFIKRLIKPLYAIDAGTDSGEDYNSKNMASSPFEPIHNLKYINGKPINQPHAFLIIQKIK